MVEDLFLHYLNLSNRLRPTYSKTLGKQSEKWKQVLRRVSEDIPELLASTYRNVSGTQWSVSDQALMDFIPGYRLIHIEEYVDHFNVLADMLRDYQVVAGQSILPLLTNYSSDYVYYNQADGSIGSFLHDEGELDTMHRNSKLFFMTICEFYEQNVYFLDEDGFLDYDMDRELNVGAQINPGIHYWQE